VAAEAEEAVAAAEVIIMDGILFQVQ
jgi:hypothetical protein